MSKVKTRNNRTGSVLEYDKETALRLQKEGVLTILEDEPKAPKSQPEPKPKPPKP